MEESENLLHKPIYFFGLHTKPALLDVPPDEARFPFLRFPLLGPLLFPNTGSDCRDHCANERTFLSWLRLSIYLAVVSSAIVISFHLKHEPTQAERRASLPLGIIFWVLSMACLSSGTANYVKTVTRYGRRQALVQTGWKTQLVFVLLTAVIVASCILFLALDARRS